MNDAFIGADTGYDHFETSITRPERCHGTNRSNIEAGWSHIHFSGSYDGREPSTPSSIVVAGMNFVLLLPEWLCTKWVWNACAKLHEPRQPLSPLTFDEEEEGENSGLSPLKLRERRASSFKIYFNNNAWKRMIFLSTASDLIAKSSSITLFSTSVLFCALIVSVDDDLPSKYALHVIPNNRSPIIELHHRALLHHYHACCRYLHVKIQ